MNALATAAALGLAPSTNVMTGPMRNAMGLLNTGGLFLDPPARPNALHRLWRCRAFPDQGVADQTVQALQKRGWASVTSYVGEGGVERRCAIATEAGRQFYHAAGGRYRELRPAPSAALLAEKFEDALGVIAEEMAGLAEDARAMMAQVEQARTSTSVAVAEGERITARIAELTRLQSFIAELRDQQRRILAGAGR